MPNVTCTKSDCPLFNFESGPFKYSENELKDIAKKMQCSDAVVHACASTNPKGYIMDEDRYFHICYECTGYGDDYYIDDNGELTCSCPECWVTKEKEKKNG